MSSSSSLHGVYVAPGVRRGVSSSSFLHGACVAPGVRRDMSFLPRPSTEHV